MRSEILRERLEESRTTYKLNLGCDALVGNNARNLEGVWFPRCSWWPPCTLLSHRFGTQLACRYCNIDELPDDFVAVVNKYNPYLLELDLTSNQLTRLPADLHELKCLRALRVKYNRIPEFPTVCFRLEQCMILDLAGNQIETIPDDIVHLRSLRELDVSGNRIAEVTGHTSRLLLPQCSVCYCRTP